MWPTKVPYNVTVQCSQDAKIRCLNALDGLSDVDNTQSAIQRVKVAVTIDSEILVNSTNVSPVEELSKGFNDSNQDTKRGATLKAFRKLLSQGKVEGIFNLGSWYDGQLVYW